MKIDIWFLILVLYLRSDLICFMFQRASKYRRVTEIGTSTSQLHINHLLLHLWATWELILSVVLYKLIYVPII